MGIQMHGDNPSPTWFKFLVETSTDEVMVGARRQSANRPTTLSRPLQSPRPAYWLGLGYSG